MMRSTHSMSVLRAEPDARELAHHRRVADRRDEQPRHLEVEAVRLVEALGVALQREAVAGAQRLVEHVGRDRDRSRRRARCLRR